MFEYVCILNFVTHCYNLLQSFFPSHVFIFFLSVEEHQSQLVQYGGLPLVITLLTEDTSEEVRKAATFILQTCKQASKSKQPCLYQNGTIPYSLQ